MHQKSQFIRRRHFLKGIGGAAVALPFLEAMGGTKNVEAPPKRMVCIGTTYSFVPQNFMPTEVGKNYTMPAMFKGLEKKRDKLTFLSQLDHGENARGGHRGVHAFLSGILNQNAESFREHNVSVDQKAAQFVDGATRYASMQMATSHDHGSTLSWSNSGVALPPVSDLNRLYAMLFQSTSSKDVDILERTYMRKKSILDLVDEDAKRLNKKISHADREKVDQYFTSIREMEKNLGQSKAWLHRPKPKVNYKLPEGASRFDLVKRVPLYYDLMALALQTDSTRVITFGLTALGPNLGGLPVSHGYHHLTHHGKQPEFLKELTIIERFHAAEFTRFIEKIDAVKESDGSTLLDNTMSLLGSGLGNASSHSNKNLPMLLAGGGFKHGQHLKFEKDRSRNGTLAANLYTSMLQQFGAEVSNFNLATGTLAGLETA